MIAVSEDIQLDSKIYIAGHMGLVGSAIYRQLKESGFTNIIVKSSKELDLKDGAEVDAFFAKELPEYIFLCAAKVGGIKANMTYPAEFIYNNLAIELNIIHAAYKYKSKKLLFLGSSCIYPRSCLQPMKEEYLLNGPLEPTNEFYAIAKIAGIKLCQAYNQQYKTKFICCMPTNIYGTGDNFNLETAHALPALIAKMHNAKVNNLKEVTVWGTGEARREWLYVDDLANACIFLMNSYEKAEIINIGTGQDISMRDLAYAIKNIVGFNGELIFDSSKPEGMPRKLLNVEKINELGWQYTTNLEAGIEKTYSFFLSNVFQ